MMTVAVGGMRVHEGFTVLNTVSIRLIALVVYVADMIVP